MRVPDNTNSKETCFWVDPLPVDADEENQKVQSLESSLDLIEYKSSDGSIEVFCNLEDTSVRTVLYEYGRVLQQLNIMTPREQEVFVASLAVSDLGLVLSGSSMERVTKLLEDASQVAALKRDARSLHFASAAVLEQTHFALEMGAVGLIDQLNEKEKMAEIPFVHISSKLNGLVVEMDPSTGKLQLAVKEDGAHHQLWRLNFKGKLENIDGLVVDSGSTDHQFDDELLQSADSEFELCVAMSMSDRKSQIWCMSFRGELENKANGLLLTVRNGSRSPRTELGLKNRLRSLAQMWFFDKDTNVVNAASKRKKLLASMRRIQDLPLESTTLLPTSKKSKAGPSRHHLVGVTAAPSSSAPRITTHALVPKSNAAEDSFDQTHFKNFVSSRKKIGPGRRSEVDL